MGDRRPFFFHCQQRDQLDGDGVIADGKGLMCGMVEISVDLILIFAANKTDKFSVFLSTSINPPKSWAIDSNI